VPRVGDLLPAQVGRLPDRVRRTRLDEERSLLVRSYSSLLAAVQR